MDRNHRINVKLQDTSLSRFVLGVTTNSVGYRMVEAAKFQVGLIFEGSSVTRFANDRSRAIEDIFSLLAVEDDDDIRSVQEERPTEFWVPTFSVSLRNYIGADDAARLITEEFSAHAKETLQVKKLDFFDARAN